jgi:hypothetical protein
MRPDSDEHYCFQWCGRMQWACVRNTTVRDCNWVLARRLGQIVPGRVESWGGLSTETCCGRNPVHLLWSDLGNVVFEVLLAQGNIIVIPPSANRSVDSLEGLLDLNYKLSSKVLWTLWDICDPDAI